VHDVSEDSCDDMHCHADKIAPKFAYAQHRTYLWMREVTDARFLTVARDVTGQGRRLAVYHLARYFQYPLDYATSCSAEARNELEMHFHLLSVPAQERHGVTFTFTFWMSEWLRPRDSLDCVESNHIFACPYFSDCPGRD